MRVIIDSNQVIQRDWFFSGPAFKELLRASKQGHIELIVPQIVFDEITNKYLEMTREAQRNLRRVSRDIDNLHLSLELDSLDDARVNELSSRFDEHLRSIMDRNNIKILPYPMVSHEVVARRALDRRKPFDTHGHKGYRDALVWSSVLEAAADGRVVLITANWSDFARSKEMADKLADDLLHDLSIAGHSADTVSLYSSVGAFVKSWIAPAALLKRQLQERIDTDSGLRDKLEGLLTSVIENISDLNIDLGPDAPEDVIEILPEVVHNFHILKIQDVRKFDDGAYLVEIFAEADVDLAVTEMGDSSDKISSTWFKTSGMSKTIDFEFDATYRDEAFADIQMTYPSHLKE